MLHNDLVAPSLAKARALLAELFAVDDGKIDDEASLLEAGILDSTGVLELVSAIEERWGFTIDDTEITPENLDSVARIARFVGSRRNRNKPGEPATLEE